jgi:FkbM family methyltransferase
VAADAEAVREINWKQMAGELRVRADRLHRSVLEKDVLRDTLPLRAQRMAGRSAAPDAVARERAFIDVSPSYAEAIAADTFLAGQMRQIMLDGLTWWVPLVRPDDPTHVARSIGHQDFPYRVIAQTRELGIGGIMLDLGANVGRMSVPRVILGDVTAVYCAEPDPLNHACLTRNVRDNHLRGLVLPDRVAVGGVTGTSRFERSSSAGGHRVLSQNAVATRETIIVPTVTVDEWVARLGVDLEAVTFVKVDVQGAEPRVMSGAAGLLAHRHIAWQLEVDPSLLTKGGSSTAELIGLVQRHFTHFIDLNRNAPGQRVRPVGDLAEALGYLGRRETHTDILACTLAARDVPATH